MSDILEDQKIHYIVKDYRRMFNNYWTLKGIIKEQELLLLAQEKKILSLEAKVEQLSNVDYKLPGMVKSKLDELESRLVAQKERTEKNLMNISELRELLYNPENNI